MFIIIKRGAAGLRERLQRSQGFTLPEVLVSLVILVMLLQSVWQWGLLVQRGQQRMTEDWQALTVAQTLLAGGSPDLPEGWTATKDCLAEGKTVAEQQISVTHGKAHWDFYYAVEKTAQETENET